MKTVGKKGSKLLNVFVINYTKLYRIRTHISLYMMMWKSTQLYWNRNFKEKKHTKHRESISGRARMEQNICWVSGIYYCETSTITKEMPAYELLGNGGGFPRIFSRFILAQQICSADTSSLVSPGSLIALHSQQGDPALQTQCGNSW